jgi:hypothetical protein
MKNGSDPSRIFIQTAGLRDQSRTVRFPNSGYTPGPFTSPVTVTP